MGLYARSRRRTAAGERVGRDTVVATSAVTGWATETGYYFSVYDRKERRWVNPMMLYGGVADDVPPVLLSAHLRGDKGQRYDLEDAKSARQGNYRVEIEASDHVTVGGAALYPYRISCALNGVDAGILALEIFAAPSGRLMLYGNDLVPADAIYERPPALAAASNVFFARGIASLEITVQDYSRNTRTARYTIRIE
jgi:hypothetical protein